MHNSELETTEHVHSQKVNIMKSPSVPCQYKSN